MSLTLALLQDYEQIYPGLDFRAYLTSPIDQKRCSMVPYLPDDTANMQDISDLAGGTPITVIVFLVDFRFSAVGYADEGPEEAKQLDKEKLSLLLGAPQQQQQHK